LLSLFTFFAGGNLVWQFHGTWITSNAMFLLPLALVTSAQIVVLELTTRDVRSRPGIVGLGVGLVAGTLLTTVLAGLVDPQGRRFFNTFSILWPAYSSLVWLSAALFVEVFTRRVGWGGVIVWAGLVGLLFGISILLG
jgi:hypothetical protein